MTNKESAYNEVHGQLTRMVMTAHGSHQKPTYATKWPSLNDALYDLSKGMRKMSCSDLLALAEILNACQRHIRHEERAGTVRA